MKNVNIFEVHWKIWHLGGGVLESQYIGGIAYKGGAWTVCCFKGSLARKRGWYFKVGWYPNAHYLHSPLKWDHFYHYFKILVIFGKFQNFGLKTKKVIDTQKCT